MSTLTAPAHDRANAATLTEPAASTPPGTSVRAARRVRLPRASTAIAVVVGAFVAFFPGRLPHGPVLQGATAALFVLAAVGIAHLLGRSGSLLRRLARHALKGDRAVHLSRPTRPHVLKGDRAVHLSRPVRRLVLACCAAALGATLAWTELTQNAMRADVGWGPAGPGYWALLLATLTAVVALVLGVRRLWRRRRVLRLALQRRFRVASRRIRPLWRAVVALAVAGAVLVPASTVQGAPAGSAAAAEAAGGSAPTSEQVLQQRSPTGAVRVYAGLRDGEDVAARAARAADQLVRAGGLRRSRVVLVIPTGSGWVDENAVRGLERRFQGDVATVALQYAHVPSWVAYLFDRDGADRAARALFRAVHARVEALPAAKRPDLHVYGESLGATAGQAIFEGTSSARAARRDVCSVLWVGTPGGATVGLPRETSVANDDDPIVHTTTGLLYADPGDGRPWLPVVSFLQAGVDFVGSLAMPDGSGHRYGPAQVRHLQTCS